MSLAENKLHKKRWVRGKGEDNIMSETAEVKRVETCHKIKSSNCCLGHTHPLLLHTYVYRSVLLSCMSAAMYTRITNSMTLNEGVWMYVSECGRKEVSKGDSAFLHWESCLETVPPNKVISSSSLYKHSHQNIPPSWSHATHAQLRVCALFVYSLQVN